MRVVRLDHLRKDPQPTMLVALAVIHSTTLGWTYSHIRTDSHPSGLRPSLAERCGLGQCPANEGAYSLVMETMVPCTLSPIAGPTPITYSAPLSVVNSKRELKPSPPSSSKASTSPSLSMTVTIGS